MDQAKQLFVDVVIFGGGIAGLWALNLLQKQGYNAILLEKNCLGGVQTINSQGIIHGGAKFSLKGTSNQSTVAIRDMPNHWRCCLDGSGDIDLTEVAILSNFQYLWSNNKLPRKFNQFLLSQVLNTKSTLLREKDYARIFHGADSRTQIFRIDENVLDIPALVKRLSEHYKASTIKIESGLCQITYAKPNEIEAINLRLEGEAIQLKANRYIFTAGEGNEALSSDLPNFPRMQRRPLRMTIAQWDGTLPLYGHYIGHSQTPILTVTTHQRTSGKYVWYIGGQLAEIGAKTNEEDHLRYAREQLTQLFPWIQFKGLSLQAFHINRAENYHSRGRRPAEEYIKVLGNMIIGWPTKLTLAPRFAQRILDELKSKLILPQAKRTTLPPLPHPEIAKPIWDI